MSKWYVPVKHKFFISLGGACLYMTICLFIGIPWFHDLSAVVGEVLAVLIIGGVGLVPGFINLLLVISSLLNKQKYNINTNPLKPITVLIAAYNEEENIYNTLKYLHQQDYQGAVTVWVADNNSTDGTKAEVERASKDFLKMPINYCFVAEQGKHFALNQALEKVETEYVVTIDADTLLHQKALRYLVARIDAYEDVGAVAGAIMAKNSRSNLWTKMQEWDYFISMAAIKKMQGMYQGTLVAQGAFSIYNTELVRSFGGWQDCIGEDIVLTWNFLKVNWKVYYEPLAVAFTEVPEKFVHLVRQRSRWARGMIEGLRAVKPWQQPNLYYKVLTLLDIAIIYIDFAYTFFFIPGVILALFGNYLIVGIMFFFVLPMTLATFIILMRLQKIQVFDQLELKVRRNIGGFILFILFYQCVMSPTALWGYAQELTGSKRTWK